MNKNLILSWVLMFISALTFAQTPGGINYQAVARDASGSLIKNKALTVKAVILTGAGGSNTEYTETHNVTTNDYGLFTIIIGEGSTSDNFGALDWGSKKHHLKIEIDNGNGFVNLGSVPFQSVPYALSAKNVENLPAVSLNDLSDVSTSGATSGQVLKFDGTSWKPATSGGSGGGTYTAGSGININGTVIEATSASPMWNANKLYGNNVVNTTPSSGEVLKWNGSAWAPATDNGTNYSAGTGVTITGSSIAANSSTAMWNASQFQGRTVANTAPSSGQVMKWNGSAWAPAADNGNTYVSGSGINITGSTIAVNGNAAIYNANKLMGRTVASSTPSSGQVLKWNGTAWAPATDNTSSGGSSYSAGTGLTLTGTTFSANSNSSIWSANKLQGRSISTSTPSSGQVLKWNGSSWAPATDNGTSYTSGSGITITGNTIAAIPNSPIWNANRILGRSVRNVLPSNGQVLTYNSTFSRWEPQTPSSGGGSSQWLTSGTSAIYTHKRVGINTSSPSNTLHLKDTITGTLSGSYASAEFSVRGSTGSSSSSYGLWVATSGNGGLQNVAIRGWGGGTGRSNGGSLGGMFFAVGTSGNENIGVYGYADKGAATRAYGMYAASKGDGRHNMGIYAAATKSHYSTIKTNYGIYAVGDSARQDYAGYFVGNVTYTGTLASASDARLKQNVEPLENALSKLLNVKVATYEYKKTGMAQHMNLPEGNQIGFIAQDLEKTFPDLVKGQIQAVGVEKDAENAESLEYKAVNYIGMVPVLTKAIQEQQEYIKALEARLKALEAQMGK